MTKQQRHDNNRKKASPKGKRKLEFIEKKKTKNPLSGKTIFLDVKDTRVKRKLEEDIRKLGATVEAFLSKDINYLITANPPPKPVKNEDTFGSPESPSVSTPSPFNMGPSPSPSNTDNTTKPATVSRGKAIYHKAKIASQNNIVVENAQKWGVKIVGLEVSQKWIQKEVSKLPADSKKASQDKKGCGSSSKGSVFKVKQLKAPFLKFEEISRQYRAVHQHLETWPHVNIDTPKGTCPFDGVKVGRDDESIGDRRDKIGLQNMELKSEEEEDDMKKEGKSKKSDSIIGPVRIVTAGEIRRRAERKKLREKKRGYCECCEIKYENLDQHIRDEQHKTFVRDKKNYESLDNLIKSTTNCNTAKFLHRTLARHLKRGKETSEDIDVSVPEAKQWTPRKSAAAKLIMKNQRHGQKEDQSKEGGSVKEKINSKFNSSRTAVTGSMKRTEVKNKNDCEDQVKSVKINDSEKSLEDTNNKDKHTKSCLRKYSSKDRGDETSNVEQSTNSPLQKRNPTLKGKSTRIEAEHQKDALVNKLDNLTVNSPVQISLLELKVNSSALDTSINSVEENITSTKKFKNKDKRHTRHNNSNDKTNCSLTEEKQEGRKKRKSKEMTEKFSVLQADLNTDQCKNLIESDSKLKKCLTTQRIDSTDNADIRNACLDESLERKMDIEKHYVPRIGKNFSRQQPCKIDWNEVNSKNCSVKDDKTCSKKWSQKFTSGNQPSFDNCNEKYKTDDVDSLCVKNLPERNSRKLISRSNTEILKKKTPEKLLNDLTKKYCEDRTIYMNLNGEHLLNVSPGRKCGKANTTRSPLSKSRMSMKDETESDIYDFRESPLKKRDVYDLSSELSLIGQESPKLNRKNKTPTSGKRTVQHRKSVYTESPQSGISNTPRSTRRKVWRKKNVISDCQQNTPGSGSSGKKLQRFKLRIPDTSAEISQESSAKSDEILEKSEIPNKIKKSPYKSKKSLDTLYVNDIKKSPSLNRRNNIDKQRVKKIEEDSMSCDMEVDRVQPVLNIQGDMSNDSCRNRNRPCQIICAEQALSPKSLKNIISERNHNQVASTSSGKNDAIKRLSPSKPFYLENVKTTKIECQKTPKNSSHTLSLSLADSGKGSSREKSPVKELVWKSANTEVKKSKKVKLNRSWSLLTDRSVGKLLASEDDNEDQFEGFSQEDISAENSLDSDASFVETTEIDLDENSHQEWVMDTEVVANEDSNDMQYLVPVFTSPGKRSDSSWDDACEGFIDSQFSFNTSNAKSNRELFSSPSPRHFGKIGSSNKRKRLSSIAEEGNGNLEGKILRTPQRKCKKRKVILDGIEKVDSEIEFNHMSPQKMHTAIHVSPVQHEDGCIIVSSSPLRQSHQTSTPFRIISAEKHLTEPIDRSNQSFNVNFKCKQRKHSSPSSAIQNKSPTNKYKRSKSRTKEKDRHCKRQTRSKCSK